MLNFRGQTLDEIGSELNVFDIYEDVVSAEFVFQQVAKAPRFRLAIVLTIAQKYLRHPRSP
jgi:hypothetical protein